MTYQYKTIDNTGDPAFNQLLAINNSGTIAGYFGDGTLLPNKGYTVTPPYSQAHFTNENFPTSVQTQVTGINDSGTTVGFWVDGNNDNYGFVDVNGTFSTAVDPLAPTIGGVVNEQFLGVNDAGEAAGFFTNDASGDTSGFVYDTTTGAFSAVTLKGAVSLSATDVNNKGQVSGFFTNASHATEGFVDTNGKFTILAGPAGASDVQALGLNDAGLVVGSYMDASGNTDGFVYNMATGTYTTVVDPNSNGTMTVLNGVNDQGQFVGFYQDNSGNVDGMLVNPGSQTFLWEFHTHDNAADPAFNQLLAINDAGTIAGYSGDGVMVPNKGYTLNAPYNANSYTNENFPSSAQTQVTGINNAGETSGFWVDGNGNSYGFVDDNGRFTTATDPLAPTINGVVNEQFLGINDEGQVAGFFTNDAAGDTSAFIYNTHTGTFAPVTIAGATSITASDINDKGQISGFYTNASGTWGFLDSNGKIVTLAGPAGATDVNALGLNNAGLVVGSYMDSHGNTDGFVYDNGTYNVVDDPNGHGMTVINGINDLDQLVGFYQGANNVVHGMLVTLQTLGASPDLVPGGGATHGTAPSPHDLANSGLGGTAALLADTSSHTLLGAVHPTGH